VSKLRVGIISANWGLQAHAPAWRALGDAVEVSAICTSRPETAEAAAREAGIPRAFWDFHALCADPDIDIVDCGTRPLLRQQMVAAALAGGKHVVNQIPFAVSAEAARAMADQQSRAGKVGIVAASILGLPQLGLMKQMIEDGFLGELFQVNCQWNISLFNPPVPNFAWPWFSDPAEGVGVTRNQGSHMLHALLHLFGPIERVTGEVETFVKEWSPSPGETVQARTDDTLNGLVRFRSGGLGQVSTSWVAVDSPGFVIEAFGRDGYLRLSCENYPSASGTTLMAAKVNPQVRPTARPVPLPDAFLTVGGVKLAAEPGSQVPSMARLYGSMVDAIRSGAEPLGSFARAAEVQRIVEAFYLASASRAWVEIDGV
jgi:predicted dehydrogenase